MTWAAGIGLFLVFLSLMVGSPGFRKIVLGIVLFILLAGAGTYGYWQLDKQRRSRAIRVEELELRDLTLNGLQSLSAVVKNNSKLHDLDEIRINITAYDCPLGDPVNWVKCETIGQDDSYFWTDIPAGQVRKVEGSVFFGAMPPIKGRFVWTYDVSEILSK